MVAVSSVMLKPLVVDINLSVNRVFHAQLSTYLNATRGAICCTVVAIRLVLPSRVGLDTDSDSPIGKQFTSNPALVELQHLHFQRAKARRIGGATSTHKGLVF